MLIGFVARAQHGKTTLANHLKEKGFTIKSFADPLKMMLMTAGLCNYNELYVEKTERSRELLQKIGTEIFRKQVSLDFWVDRMALSVNKTTCQAWDVVIDDVRMPNEANFIKANDGLLIKIVRWNVPNQTYHEAPNTDHNHDTEKLVDVIEPDFTLEACEGEIEQLKADMDFILKDRR